MEKDKVEVNGSRSFALPLFLTGLGTGIAVALLFAPRSGSATRSLIGRQVKDCESWTKRKGAAAKDYVLSHGADIRDRVKDVAEVIGREAPLGSHSARP
jgi:gas vesicle protein